MFVSVLERQKAILEDVCHHTVYCRKVIFRIVDPTRFCASGNVSNLAMTGSRFVDITPWGLEVSGKKHTYFVRG